jgi:hypothetical protein
MNVRNIFYFKISAINFVIISNSNFFKFMYFLVMLLIDREKNEDESLKRILERFQIDRVDPMEFYLLKSISLFKSGIV